MERFYTIAKKGFLLLTALLFVLSSTCLNAEAGGFTISTIDPSLKGSITVLKYVQDQDNEDQKVPLVGTQYRITYRYRLDESEVMKGDSDFYQAVAATDRNGGAQFKDLELGVYLVEEIDGVLSGYEKSDDFLVSVPMTNQTEVTYDGVTYEAGTIWEYDITAVPKNEKIYGRVKLMKYDANTRTKLKGAVFQLFYQNGDPYQLGDGTEVKLTTDEQGEILIKDLPFGHYYLVEVEAPKGYKLSNEKYFFDIVQSYREGEEDTVVKLVIYNVKLPEGELNTEPQTDVKPPAETGKTPPKQTEAGRKWPGSTEGGSGSGTKGTTGKRPSLTPAKTGDETNIIFWLLLLGAALATEICLKVKQKR